ncbi:MAG TPA: hypothetical protein VFG86_22855 [Chloroflexota bacterium]|nr:hypothetical protein [Chloroflexota bacterium]
MRGAVIADEYTPFGYLRNPGHRASSWSAVEGGNLRSALDRVGVEWIYPLQRNPRASAGIRLETRTRRTRADFAAVGLTSRYHSANMLGFDWRADGLEVAARFFLVDEDALAARLDAPAQHDVTFVRHAQGEPTDLAHVLVLAEGNPRWAVLARAQTQEAARQHAQVALGHAEERYRELLAEDAAFTARCPLLSGDWPGGWCAGLEYDFETTRLLVQPPRGIFTDLWPAWMVSWPRVVLAEGALDMLRLAYADTDTAQRAVLSMFRDAPQPNVPCVFEDGSYNMLAADGARCGTSPAWCLPFLNLELLYLRTLDRDWLRSLYPYLTAYLDFWLRERVDRQGWVVYKCTWESGEDGNPRLDPTRSGDGVIEARVRPVELQATMAHAARVMRFFAAELGVRDELPRWRRVERAYRQRTRRLFDPTERRYRDWLTQEQRFQEPRPDQPYWGVDSCRWSPLGLTPLLIGEPLDADEVWRHAKAPWTWWPSWTYALVESASAAGYFERVGVLAAEIVERVYRVTTRQELGNLERPMPGCAPEFWPQDWPTYQGHDAYGWGATTANLLLRHIFGFKESRVTRSCVLELTPALPPSLRVQGRRLGVRQLNYRGVSFDLEYAVERDGVLNATLQLRTREKRCTLKNASGERVYGSKRSAQQHEFELHNGQGYRLELR